MAAYAFVSDHYGHDIGSAWFWQEYISLAKAFDTDNPWDRIKEVQRVQKLYQRATEVPMAELDAIWREYEGFERENVRTNSMTQDAALAKARDRHANAKRCYRERKQLWDKVDRGMLAR